MPINIFKNTLKKIKRKKKKTFDVFFTFRSVLLLMYTGLLPVPSFIEQGTMFFKLVLWKKLAPKI